MASTHDLQLPYVAPRARRGSGTTNLDPQVERVRKIARALDTYMVDPLIGLILPGAGDIVGSMLGLYTVALAVRRKMSPVIIARMLLNLALDAVIGLVPLIGDLTDLAFKANTKNVALLTERTDTGGRASGKDWLAVAGAGLLFVGALSLVIFVMYSVITAIF
ncbi:MAG: DUF4112 domain-containing protein [Kofleriaceae bacterium]